MRRYFFRTDAGYENSGTVKMEQDEYIWNDKKPSRAGAFAFEREGFSVERSAENDRPVVKPTKSCIKCLKKLDI